MKIEFMPLAKIEFADAIDYYNDQREGWGDVLAFELNAMIEQIAFLPEAGVKVARRTRRRRLKRFPYGILYQRHAEIILIVAITHIKRRPNAWKSRLPRKDR